MTIYVLLRGEWYDLGVYGVTDSLEKAEEWRRSDTDNGYAECKLNTPPALQA
jgi:hypothetical protein